MEKIRIWGAFCLSAVLLISLVSCGGRRIPWDYRESAFRARLRWESSEGIPLEGELEAAVGDGSRDVTLRFLAPETLEGIVLTRRSGRTVITLDGMSVEVGDVGDLLGAIELLLPEGEMTAVAPTEREGETLLYAEVKEEGERIYEIYLEEKTGIPREVRLGERWVKVASFETVE